MLDLVQNGEQIDKVLPLYLFVAVCDGQHRVGCSERDESARELLVRVDVLFLLALRDFVQRRLGQVYVAPFDQFGHLSIEEGEQKCANVRTVHVRICHDDDLVVADFVDVKIVNTDACTNCRDESSNLVVVQNLVESGLFHIQHLAAKWKNGLSFAIAALFGRAAGAVALHDEDFAL